MMGQALNFDSDEDGSVAGDLDLQGMDPKEE